MNIRLTPTAQGTDDVYWCDTDGKAVVVRNHTCPECMNKRSAGARAWDEWYGHKFLAHVQQGDEVRNEMVVIAEAVKGADDAESEISVLREAIDHFAQQVHQGYHGASGPDVCDVNHTECSRGLCRSVQHVLSPKRKRGVR
jgi:hypothetical protein